MDQFLLDFELEDDGWYINVFGEDGEWIAQCVSEYFNDALLHALYEVDPVLARVTFVNVSPGDHKVKYG